ncbi:hypothetical protein RS82_01115 [Microbacterium trichothecenolyticum]|uniref:Uncharacterized protein n=1 Tax=Microbacterium trichothecenolyticum TaxID=69370 RepID=A0A0M2HCC4_MICTR|nr:hypothetical protein RS82_01115 [Microbacterium trichothecenolyticum]
MGIEYERRMRADEMVTVVRRPKLRPRSDNQPIGRGGAT